MIIPQNKENKAFTHQKSIKWVKALGERGKNWCKMSEYMNDDGHVHYPNYCLCRYYAFLRVLEF